MAEINFYHLSQSSLDKALAKLLEKMIATGKRAVVWTGTSEKAEELNMGLWTYSQSSFLPHGTAEDGFVDQQPIYLTAQQENPNNANFVVTTGDVAIQDFMNFERCFDIFNGQNSISVTAARSRWKDYQQANHQLVYWQQNETGGWQRKEV